MSVTTATWSGAISTRPFADGEESLPAVPVHDDLARHDLRDQPDVLRVDANLALERRQGDHVHVFGEDDRLRRDDFEFQRFGHSFRPVAPAPFGEPTH